MDKPWLAQEAVLFLDQWLRPSDRILEFGSGRSTHYFAQKCSRVVSHEHHFEWANKVSEAIAKKGWTHVSLVHREDERYVSDISDYEDASFDCILVDGVYRYETFLASIAKVSADGLIIVDNINYFLPGSQRCPGGKAPGPADTWDDESKRWQAAIDALPGPWRQERFCDGVIDTLFLFRGDNRRD